MLYRYDTCLKNVNIKNFKKVFIDITRNMEENSDNIIKEIRIIDKEPKNNSYIMYTRSSYGPFAS